MPALSPNQVTYSLFKQVLIANVANKLIDQFICIVSKQDLERKKIQKIESDNNSHNRGVDQQIKEVVLTESLSLTRLCCLVYF